MDVRIPQLSRRDKSVRTIKEAQRFKYTDKDDGSRILKATDSHIKLFKISRGSDYTISDPFWYDPFDVGCRGDS